MKSSFTLSFVLFSILTASAQAPQLPQIDIFVAPATVKIDGRDVTYHEMHFTNTLHDSITILALHLANGDSPAQILPEQTLIDRFALRSGKKTSRPTIPPGASAVLYLETEIRNKTDPSLYPVTRIQIADKPPTSIVGPVINVSLRTPVVLGSPVSKGIWAAVYDPSWVRGHRRVIFKNDGKEKIPGRYAIDFIQLDEQGQYFKADENVVANWFGYGADVIAVADGFVTAAQDDFKESKTLKAHPSYPAEKATGNYISIDIGDNQYAFYEHLKPGSIKVRVGQKVKKGDVIASLGFTGQSTGPHLHFHVADTNSPLGAEGIPFVFESFELLGSYPDFSTFGKSKWVLPPSENNSITNERPAPNTVIRF